MGYVTGEFRQRFSVSYIAIFYSIRHGSIGGWRKVGRGIVDNRVIWDSGRVALPSILRYRIN